MVAVALLLAALAGRTLYGLSMPFWFEDERQVFLIGLRSFARGEWPYFGADVVWTGGQLPGALQAMLVRWPLAAWPAPEAPFILLNLLSWSTLGLFAWYLCRRLPQVPRWLVWGALFTLPWTLNFSTHLINTSFVLPGAILFFIGFLEGMPLLSRRIVPFTLAWALMGAGLLFVAQIHMSWVLLPPYVIAAAAGVLAGRAELLPRSRNRLIVTAPLAFVAGAAAIGWLLVPTLARYGLDAGTGGGVLHFDPQSPAGLVTTAARMLSFVSFETNRFLGMSSAERIVLLARLPWLVPFVVVVTIAGVWQPIWMALSLFRRATIDRADWIHVRALWAATVVLVYVSYFFSIRGPQAHAFYVVFPVAMLFAGTCWEVWSRAAGVRWRRWERVAAVILACGIVMHAGLAVDRWPRASLYANRPVVATAIHQRNDRLLGDRRDTIIERQDHEPRVADRVPDPAAFMSARPENDLQLRGSTWRRGPFDVSIFDVSVTNRSAVTAWLDVRYETRYFGPEGQILASRQGVLKHIFEPGDTREWTAIADDFVPSGASSATLIITGAERAIPIRHN